MIILINKEKVFCKIQHIFMIKLSHKNKSKGNLPYHNKWHLWKTHSSHHIQWWKIKSFLPKIRNKTRMPAFTTAVQRCAVSFSQSNKTRGQIKQKCKGRNKKSSLFADDFILSFLKIQMKASRANRFSKLAGFKMAILSK